MNESELKQNMEQNCPKCGAPLPSGVLAGLCPACLLKQGAAADTGVAAEAPPFVPPSVEEVAKLFPQLEVLGLIGKGGMGAVYQARQPGLDRLVALKILPPHTASEPGFVERFNREARALARLSHPNIVAVHEFGQVNGLPYFIMEFVDGVNLRELERAGKLSPREALQIVPQICEALQFAHDEGVVHRDIKPENILLDRKGRVKIADFGIAKILGATSGPDLTKTQSVVGTPMYMAPEQMEKPTTVDHRADIFSLGVVFYEMLTGELPLGKFGPPSSRKVEVDVRLDDVVLRSLEKDPDRRYQHASQVKTAVDTIAGSAAPPPIAPAANAAGMAGEILAKDYQLNIRSCVRRGWKLLKGEFWPFVGITALFLALFSFAGTFGTSTIQNHTEGTTTVEVMSAVATVIFGPLWGGLLFYFLKKVRMEPATVETAFCGFSHRFLHLFLAGFVATSLIVVGFICFILPGIYLMIAWMFTLVIVVDKQVDFWSAMELSRKVVTKHWFKLFGFGLVLWLLTFAGVLALIIGVFVTFPLALASLMYAYEDIFGGVTGGVPAPAPGATGPTGTIVMPGPIAPSATREPWSLATKIGVAAVVVVVALLAFRYAVVHHQFSAPESNFTRTVEQKQIQPVENQPQPVPVVAAGSGGGEVPANPPPPPVFAPTVELTLTNLAAVNLASGEQKTISPYLAEQITGEKGKIIHDWMQRADVDLGFIDGLACGALAGVATWKSQIWDGADPAALAEALATPGQDLSNRVDVFSRFAGAPLTNFAYGFKTRGGRMGLLEFVSFVNDSPQSAKIRYKLLDSAAPKGAAAEAGGNGSSEALTDRLEAASNIVDGDVRDRTLADIAIDAAKAGQVSTARRAVGLMVVVADQNSAIHDTALLLAKHGYRRPAIEMAKTISDGSLRDQMLSELAQ